MEWQVAYRKLPVAAVLTCVMETPIQVGGALSHQATFRTPQLFWAQLL